MSPEKACDNSNLNIEEEITTDEVNINDSQELPKHDIDLKSGDKEDEESKILEIAEQLALDSTPIVANENVSDSVSKDTICINTAKELGPKKQLKRGRRHSVEAEILEEKRIRPRRGSHDSRLQAFKESGKHGKNFI